MDPHFHQHIPIPKLSDGCPPFWDMAQLQEGQDSPHVLSLSPVPGDGRGSPAAAETPGSYTQLSGPKFVQFPTCPALQGRAGLGYLLWSNLRVMRTPLLGLNLFFQWTGLKSEMLPVTQTARCLLWGGIPLETQKLNLKKWALEAQVLLQPWYWRAARTPG